MRWLNYAQLAPSVDLEALAESPGLTGTTFGEHATT
jgi:hypothetical protein